MEVLVMLVREGSGAVAPFAQGVTWGGLSLSARRIATVATSFLVAAGVAGPAMATAAQAATPSDADLVSVVVQETGGGNGPERAVQAYGGAGAQGVSVISGFSAEGAREPPDPPRGGSRGSPGTPGAPP